MIQAKLLLWAKQGILNIQKLQKFSLLFVNIYLPKIYQNRIVLKVLIMQITKKYICGILYFINAILSFKKNVSYSIDTTSNSIDGISFISIYYMTYHTLQVLCPILLSIFYILQIIVLLRNRFRCKVQKKCSGSTGQHEAVDFLDLKETSQKKFKEWQKQKQQCIDHLCKKVCNFN